MKENIPTKLLGKIHAGTGGGGGGGAPGLPKREAVYIPSHLRRNQVKFF
ncbi:hypothetical protein [Pseudoalteromonas rubra]|nr:hypothetical protein [Pseudoalteromonas rubra]